MFVPSGPLVYLRVGHSSYVALGLAYPLYVADQQLQLPSQVAGQPAWAGPRALRGTPNNRTFQQIIEEEKKNRNKPEDSQESQSETTKSQKRSSCIN